MNEQIQYGDSGKKRKPSPEATERHDKKMALLGRLSMGVAHDFNNLLTTMLGFSRLALEKLPEDHPACEDIEDVIASAKQAAILTERLLAFGQKRPTHIEPVNLNKAVGDADKILRRTLGADIELVTLTHSADIIVMAERIALEQALILISVNAREYLRPGGRLYVQTQVLDVNEEEGNRLGLMPMPYGVLSVSVDSDVQDGDLLGRLHRISKEMGVPGHELEDIIGVIKAFEGTLSISHEQEHITRCAVFIPLAKDVKPDDDTIDSLLPKGKESLLLVEDTESVRKYSSRILSSLGYTVTEAATGEEALRIADTENLEMDALVTDMVMPGMSGKELARSLRKNNPALKVLYCTGYPGQVQMAPEINSRYLLKPFSRDDIATALRELLDQD